MSIAATTSVLALPLAPPSALAQPRDGRIWYVTSDPDSNVVANLSGTTAFLLLCVFTVLNVACLVLRGKRDPTSKVFFTSPGQLPLVVALLPSSPVRGSAGPSLKTRSPEA